MSNQQSGADQEAATETESVTPLAAVQRIAEAVDQWDHEDAVRFWAEPYSTRVGVLVEVSGAIASISPLRMDAANDLERIFQLCMERKKALALAEGVLSDLLGELGYVGAHLQATLDAVARQGFTETDHLFSYDHTGHPIVLQPLSDEAPYDVVGDRQ